MPGAGSRRISGADPSDRATKGCSDPSRPIRTRLGGSRVGSGRMRQAHRPATYYQVPDNIIRFLMMGAGMGRAVLIHSWLKNKSMLSPDGLEGPASPKWVRGSVGA